MAKAKNIVLRPIRPSVAIKAKLQRELLKRYAFLRDRMAEVMDLYRKLRKAQERAEKPATGFSDGTTAETAEILNLMEKVKKMLKKIRNDFNAAFPAAGDEKLARDFVNTCNKDIITRNNMEFSRAVQDFVVRVQMTEAKKVILKAATQEATGLIKNLGAKAQFELEDTFNRCLMEGRNIGEMVESIEKVLGVTRRRAINLAFDQTNKIENALDRQAKLDLGLHKAIWRHSHGWVKTEPRKSHVAADGRKYDIREGCKIDGEFIQPGEKPFCGCYSQAIIELPGGK